VRAAVQAAALALARERLAVLRDTRTASRSRGATSSCRGPGELLGTRRPGLMQMPVADLMRDADLLPGVQRAAQAMLDGPAKTWQRCCGAGSAKARRFGKV
jgi:ATP-dependent DNA helicase RecG